MQHILSKMRKAIEDYNMIDPYYTEQEAINYNRDVEAFEILRKF